MMDTYNRKWKILNCTNWIIGKILNRKLSNGIKQKKKEMYIEHSGFKSKRVFVKFSLLCVFSFNIYIYIF